MYQPDLNILQDPDLNGHYGIHGGRYVPETLMPLLLELDEEYKKIRNDKNFWQEAYELLQNYVGRPTPLFLHKIYQMNLMQKYI